MKITVLDSEKQFDDVAAGRVVEQITEKKNSVIGLSTGRTTGNMHRRIAQLYKEKGFDISELTLFGVDEVIGVPREYFGACYTMLKTEIVDGLGLDDNHFLMLPTKSDDFAESCAAFVEEIGKRGGIDLLVLGLGENGHRGFNQPGSPFGLDAWTTKMNIELEERIGRETGIKEGLGGATLGLKGMMNARRIVLVAKGKNKAGIVKEMFGCPITPEVPASVLRLHPEVEFIFDAEAASLINPKTIR